MERTVGLLFVLAFHAAVIWGLWQQRMLPAPQNIETLFVSFIAPPAPEQKEMPKPPPKPKTTPIERPPLRPIVAEAVTVAPTDYVIPPLPKPAPSTVLVSEAPLPPTSPLPAGPVALSSELAVACPDRAAPAYPALSRRLGEEGIVMLRVELDETGRITDARVSTSSGFIQLDEAAVRAVRGWHCNPAQRNGLAVPAVARQSFKFVLQGN